MSSSSPNTQVIQTPSIQRAAHRPRPSLVRPDQTVRVSLDELWSRVTDIAGRFASQEHATFIADKIVLAERMGVPTHGLHYFLEALLPHLRTGNVNEAEIRSAGSVVLSNGTGGVGFLQLHRCLMAAGDVARQTGIAIAVMNKPGKVGALRVFCPELIDRGQMVLMAKNTARTIGIPETGEPVLGTNPLCIGLPDTRFIYDSTISTVATNRIRLLGKYGQRAPAIIGLGPDMRPTDDPGATLASGGFLLPFSFGPYWFKSFFLGIAIEAFAAMAGGATSHRVGEHTGKRLHSKEGMIAIVVDRSAFPAYDSYLSEVGTMLHELESRGLRIPGDYDPDVSTGCVLSTDWRTLQDL